MINRISYILFALGIIGVIAFWMLRPQIDMNANGAISKSSSEVSEQMSEIAVGLGFSMDSLSTASMFEQHSDYLRMLSDSLSEKVTPALLNKRGVHIQSWATIIAEPGTLDDMVLNINTAFQSVGKLGIRTSNLGNVIRLSTNPEFSNPTFVQGDSIEAVASKIVGDVFGYNLNDYVPLNSQVSDSLLFSVEGEAISQPQAELGNSESPTIDIEWVRRPGVATGPETLSLSLNQVFKEFQTATGFNTKFGYQVSSFVAKNELEPEDLNVDFFSDFPIFTYVLVVMAVVLAILVFAVGIRNIFKGKVEWRRSLAIFVLIATAFFGWREIFYTDVFGDLFNAEGLFMISLNNLLYGLVMGLYAAMAYISWEAFARSQKNGELELIDAFWQRKFFIKETGASLIHGFFLGGLLLGLFACGVYLQDSFFMQSDSQFGYAEGSIRFKILTINMTAWSTVWLIGFGQIGFIYGFCRHWIKQNFLSIAVSVFVTTLLISLLGRLVATPLEIWKDVTIFSMLALAVVLAYHRFGIVTVNTAWWVFVCVILMMPYIGSDSVEMASTWWVQGFLIAGIPIFGFVTYRYGVPVSEVGDYIPEYEERIAQHLRVEKEIEIARESQYKLMPVQPPVGEGFDVYGFFLPSFEVGGDYFDYVLSKDEDGKATGLTMVVVDVSGKAMRAAMPAIFTSGLLLARMKEDAPEVALTKVNEPIYTRTDKRTFITCAMAKYDLESKTISVVNAGHCKPILKRNGVADFIQTPEPRYPLGVKEDTVYQAQEFKLKKGDVFLLYSDGLPEAVNEQGERFGFEEVPRLLERIHTEKLSSSEIAQEIKRTVQKFSNYQLADDTTVICLKV
ncbi:MAG: PP2C family protein-serine/threonine phosphatase [Balneola sp.]